MSSRPLIKDSLHFLNICGINFYKSNAWTNLRAIGTLTVISLCWLNLLQALIMHWEGLESMQTVALFAAMYKLISEYCMVMYYRKRFSKIITTFESFWSVERCSRELKEEIESSLAFIRRCTTFLSAVQAIMGLGFAMIALLRGKLPLEANYPFDTNIFPYYELAYLLELSMILIGRIANLGVCCLFLALIINITCELKMLKEGFEKLAINHELQGESNEDLSSLYQLVDHHVLIAECIQRIQEVYSIYLLNVYFYSTACIGLGLICIVGSGFPPSFESLARFGVLVVFYAFNLFFYCAAGTYLTSECEQISGAVYEIKWWIKTQPKLRRACVVILSRANKAETLTAGGVFILNLDSFTKVMKNTFSLFTLVEAMYEN